IFCGDEEILGSEFYLMERRKGLIIRGETSSISTRAADAEDPDTGNPLAVLSMESSQEFRKQVCKSFISNLVDLHSLDYKAAGLGDFGKPEGYTKRQVEGWTKRYINAKTDEHPELESAIKWLNKNIPDSRGAALIHNDYKFDNVMLDPTDLTEITAVLDWEMTTIGEPLMDLGSSLAYWMSKDEGEEMLSMPFNPRILMENISRRELVEMYEEMSGSKVSDIVFYYVFGTFKLAVIAQQIYYRYVNGFTQDKRFAAFGHFVNSLGKIGLRSIERNKI
ncbi:MAG: phosphotransferase family protein, partial [Acidobacteria bacterium]|nr:phosphotransferase family protein [Acidobacteriota bacterium]